MRSQKEAYNISPISPEIIGTGLTIRRETGLNIPSGGVRVLCGPRLHQTRLDIFYDFLEFAL